MSLTRAEHYEQIVQSIAAAHRASAANIRRFIEDRTSNERTYNYCPACLAVLSAYGHCAGCDIRHGWADERRDISPATNQERRS